LCIIGWICNRFTVALLWQHSANAKCQRVLVLAPCPVGNIRRLKSELSANASTGFACHVREWKRSSGTFHVPVIAVVEARNTGISLSHQLSPPAAAAAAAAAVGVTGNEY